MVIHITIFINKNLSTREYIRLTADLYDTYTTLLLNLSYTYIIPILYAQYKYKYKYNENPPLLVVQKNGYISNTHKTDGKYNKHIDKERSTIHAT